MEETEDTRVQSLAQEDALEKEIATHSSILAQKIPWMEEPAGLTVHGVTKSQTRLSDFTFSTISHRKKIDFYFGNYSFNF